MSMAACSFFQCNEFSLLSMNEQLLFEMKLIYMNTNAGKSYSHTLSHLSMLIKSILMIIAM